MSFHCSTVKGFEKHYFGSSASSMLSDIAKKTTFIFLVRKRNRRGKESKSVARHSLKYVMEKFENSACCTNCSGPLYHPISKESFLVNVFVISNTKHSPRSISVSQLSHHSQLQTELYSVELTGERGTRHCPHQINHPSEVQKTFLFRLLQVPCEL